MVQAILLHETPRGPVAPDPWRRASARLPDLHHHLQEAGRERGLLGQAARHHLATPGRCFRGLLVMATGEALRVAPPLSLGLAVACELLHAASLVHDDLEDRDVERRGQATVWHRFGEDTALHLGDLLIARSFDEITRLPVDARTCVELLRRFTATTQQAVRGQAAEASALSQCPDPNDYERCVRHKTGALLALPVQAALVAAGCTAADEETVGSALGALGTAYQIQDDLLDLFGRKAGRSAGTDLGAGRFTAPVVHYLAGAPSAERRRLRAFLGGRCDRWDDAGRWAERLRRAPAIDSCLLRVVALEREGLQALEPLEEPLRRLLSYTATRILEPSRELSSLRPQKSEPVLRILPAPAASA